MWPGQTGCDAVTAVLSMETRALVFECMCLVCVYVLRLLVCPHYSFALRRVTGSSGGVLYKKYRLGPQINAHKLSASPSLTFSLIFFFFLLCNLIQEWKAFFFAFTAPWHPESFSFCSLGEAANALDETLKSLSFHLILWQVNLISLPSCLKYIFGKKMCSKNQGCTYAVKKHGFSWGVFVLLMV